MDEKQIQEFMDASGAARHDAERYLAAAAEAEAEIERRLRPFFASATLPVLELGAGCGAFTREILKIGLPADGKLIAVERLAGPAERMRAEIDDPRLEVLCCDASDIPLPDGSVGLVVSRLALHDAVSADGEVLSALRDSVRVLAPGGVFLVRDKIRDGFSDPERESAEARMERMNGEMAALEGKRCWGLHALQDYRDLFAALGLEAIESVVIPMPAVPGYVRLLNRTLEEKRPHYVRHWGDAIHEILDRLRRDLESVPPRALPHALLWGVKRER